MNKSPESTIFDFLRKSSRSKLLSISLKKTQKSCYKGQFQISFNLFEHAISNSDLNLSPEWKILAKIGQKWPSKWSISADFHYYGQGTSMYVLEMDEYQLVVEENIHIEHFLPELMMKSVWMTSKIVKIGQNQEKITDVPHFGIKLAPYKNFRGMKTMCDRENTTRGREYQKMKKIVGGARATIKSAHIFLMNEKIPWVHDFWFSQKIF